MMIGWLSPSKLTFRQVTSTVVLTQLSSPVYGRCMICPLLR